MALGRRGIRLPDCLRRRLKPHHRRDCFENENVAYHLVFGFCGIGGGILLVHLWLDGRNRVLVLYGTPHVCSQGDWRVWTMKKITLATALAVITAACTQAPPKLCDRDAIEWDKWGTVELPSECQPTGALPIGPTPTPEEGDDTTPPETDGPSPSPDPVDEADDKVKGNNGWGNGDQAAPGNSRDRNNAENSDRTQRNHGQGRRN